MRATRAISARADSSGGAGSLMGLGSDVAGAVSSGGAQGRPPASPLADSAEARHTQGMDASSTVLADPVQGLSEYEQELISQVREYGWRSTHVFDPDGGAPAFTYTTGFWLTLGYPEVIVFDFPGDLAHDVLGQMFREIRRGRVLPTAEPVEGILSGENIQLLPARPETAAEYLLSSKWFYKDNAFPCLQLVWPDHSGMFPWEDGFDPRLADLQPDLREPG
jgi:hypothetical protein